MSFAGKFGREKVATARDEMELVLTATALREMRVMWN
jgi:hypothetical protein